MSCQPNHILLLVAKAVGKVHPKQTPVQMSRAVSKDFRMKRMVIKQKMENRRRQVEMEDARWN